MVSGVQIPALLQNFADLIHIIDESHSLRVHVVLEAPLQLSVPLPLPIQYELNPHELDDGGQLLLQYFELLMQLGDTHLLDILLPLGLVLNPSLRSLEQLGAVWAAALKSSNLLGRQ